MGDLERVMNALRTADEAGNTEDAIKLSGIARRLSKQQEEPSKDAGIMPFVNRAIATTIGAPVDIGQALIKETQEIGAKVFPEIKPLVSVPEEPFGGRKSVERGMRAIGIPVAEREPKTLAEYTGAGIGEVVSFLIPFTKASQMASKGTGLVSRVSKSIWQGIIKHPWIAGISEVTGGAGMGAGRYVGEEVFPERPLVRPFAELAGGVAGGIAPTAVRFAPTVMGIRKGKELIQKASLPFTEKGAKYRAGKFLKKQVVSPEETILKATEKTIGDLPPIVATGEKRLMVLFKQFRDADPITDADAIKKISKSIYKLEQELRSMGYGAPEVLKSVIKKQVASIELSIQKRITDSMNNAQKRLNALPVAERTSRESIIVREELEKVMKKEFADTQVLWNDVPKKLEVTYSGSKQAYKNIKSDLAIAQREDMPSILKGSIITKKGELTTLKEMQGLRSKLLEVQRIASKDGKWNKARIAGEIADAILDDLDLAVDDSLSLAIMATREFKKRFEQGIVGKILGRSKFGVPAISPELTLDISIGRAGLKGTIDIDKVAITPDAIIATKRYISRSFTDYVTDKGTKSFNVTKAQKWIAGNEEILDKFPELRSQMNDIAGSQKLADDTLVLMEARKKRLQDPRISNSARFLNADIGKEVDTIFKSSNPTNMTKELVRQARKDGTGEALEGLKGSYIDHILEKSSIGAYNELGEQTLSGRTLQAFMNKNRTTLREIFSQEEIVRMERIGKELSKLEMAESIQGKMVDIVMDDMPSNFLRMASRVGGAQIGRWVARVTGGGTVQTPGIFSERFKNFAQHLTKDRAFQLLHDAIISEDGKLLRALLLPIDKPTLPSGLNNLKILNTRMNLWLLGTGSRVLEDIKKEEAEEIPQPSMEAL